MTTKYYVAYGSNLNVSQMNLRCPAATALSPVFIHDWQLVMRGVADIEAKRGGIVPAGLWHITPECEKELDRYEGYPRMYIKRDVVVHLPDRETVVAMAYVMRYGSIIPYSSGSQSYVQTIREGYEHFGLDPHLETLWRAQRMALRVARRSLQKRA